MKKYNINFSEFLYNLFIIIDDFLKYLPKKLGQKLGRKSSLSPSEIISMILFGIFLGFKTKLDLYRHIFNYHIKDFPNLPTYKSFNELTNKYSQYALQIISIIMHFNIKNSTLMLKFIDSTCIAVCKNKRIFTHKVCKDFAKRGKSTMGWFYGFKLHICVDQIGNLLSLRITSGNVNDRNPVIDLLKNIKGLVIADGGYLSEELQKDLFQKGINFLTGVKKNMKKLMTKSQHKLLKARQIVETAFGNLKQGKNLVSSYARSILGHFARIIYAVLAYTLRNLQHEELNCIS